MKKDRFNVNVWFKIILIDNSLIMLVLTSTYVLQSIQMCVMRAVFKQSDVAHVASLKCLDGGQPTWHHVVSSKYLNDNQIHSNIVCSWNEPHHRIRNIKIIKKWSFAFDSRECSQTLCEVIWTSFVCETDRVIVFRTLKLSWNDIHSA